MNTELTKDEFEKIYDSLDKMMNTKEKNKNIQIGEDVKRYLNEYTYNKNGGKIFQKDKKNPFDTKEEKHFTGYILTYDECVEKNTEYLKLNSNGNLSQSIHGNSVEDFVEHLKKTIDMRINCVNLLGVYNHFCFQENFNTEMSSIDIEYKIKTENIIGLIDQKNNKLCDTILVWIDHSNKMYNIMFELDENYPYFGKNMNYNIDEQFKKEIYGTTLKN